MLIVILAGFAAAMVLALTGRWMQGRVLPWISLLPFGMFAWFLSLLPEVRQGPGIFLRYTWVPSMGIHLDFRLDGLSMLFALLITGIGGLVFLYAGAYMKGQAMVNRFFAYLSMFMSAMLGLVLSDNLFLLFIFWELTSISSFFLIGFNHANEASRQSSMVALAITGGGGFFLMAGFALMGTITGTYSIYDMSQSGTMLKESSLYPWLLILLFFGAFTKSAQFPLHFWLPGAMKAPTPVSAYLHSATMVKAGVYLLARLSPVAGDHPYWNNTLMIVGGLTMLYSAFHSTIRTDLKAILAYSTISALGMLVFLLGVGTDLAFVAAAVFILVHALYKAGLFMVTGIIDHALHTRNVKRLWGLQRVMPVVAAAGWLAAISSAGIPLSIGFVGKELIYEALLHAGGGAVPILLTSAAVATNVMLLYAGFTAGVKPFTGQLPQAFSKARQPGPGFWLAPLLLGLLAVVWGIYPAMLDEGLIRPIARSIRSTVDTGSLGLWHGFSLTLALSTLTLVAGVIFYFVKKPTQITAHAVARLDVISPQRLLSRAARSAELFSLRYTRTLHNGYLRSYLRIIILFLILLVSYKLVRDVEFMIDTTRFTPVSFHECIAMVIMGAAIIATVFTRSRLSAVAYMGVIGLSICMIFVYYGAPDLAMTQFIIDTLTVVLFVLVLFRLPPFLSIRNPRVLLWDGIVALSFGGLIGMIALQAYSEPVSKDVSQFYADNAYILAKGKNIVNVILVDFRGADTMIEIIVLSIAALGVYSLMKLRIKSTEKE